MEKSRNRKDTYSETKKSPLEKSTSKLGVLNYSFDSGMLLKKTVGVSIQHFTAQ